MVVVLDAVKAVASTTVHTTKPPTVIIWLRFSSPDGLIANPMANPGPVHMYKVPLRV